MHTHARMHTHILNCYTLARIHVNVNMLRLIPTLPSCVPVVPGSLHPTYLHVSHSSQHLDRLVTAEPCCLLVTEHVTNYTVVHKIYFKQTSQHVSKPDSMELVIKLLIIYDTEIWMLHSLLKFMAQKQYNLTQFYISLTEAYTLLMAASIWNSLDPRSMLEEIM